MVSILKRQLKSLFYVAIAEKNTAKEETKKI